MAKLTLTNIKVGSVITVTDSKGGTLVQEQTINNLKAEIEHSEANGEKLLIRLTHKDTYPFVLELPIQRPPLNSNHEMKITQVDVASSLQ
jgi:hypothetical protein